MTERPDIEAIIAEIDRKAKERAERIPDTQAALRLMFDCCERLKELGWRDMMYAPKDMRAEQVITWGSTGIFAAQWMGTSWFVEDGGDLWPSEPLMYQPSEEELNRMSAKMRAAILSVYRPHGEEA